MYSDISFNNIHINIYKNIYIYIYINIDYTTFCITYVLYNQHARIYLHHCVYYINDYVNICYFINFVQY